MTLRGSIGPNIDPEARADEAPIHAVVLRPFFLSKFEMTQGQWLAFTGKNPSAHRPGEVAGGKTCSLLHPVENVSQETCRTILWRMGLELPTEAQWERAARAGTTTVWWTGNDPRSLDGAANLADRFWKDNGGPENWKYDLWLDDGSIKHAPVTAFRPNPFGLNGVHGNVGEWCLDAYAERAYDLPWEPGSGLRRCDGEFRVTRGGTFGYPASFARASFRLAYDGARFQDGYLGVRPARALVP